MTSRRTSGLATLALVLCAAPAVADPFGHSAAMRRFESGNYYVHASFGNGVDAEFLVDTGSSYVAVSKATFERLERVSAVTYLRQITGSMANGDLVRVPVYRVAYLSLGETCLLRDIEVTVMPGNTRDILGLSALSKVQPFAMQLDPPVLLLSNCELPPIS